MPYTKSNYSLSESNLGSTKKIYKKVLNILDESGCDMETNDTDENL